MCVTILASFFQLQPRLREAIDIKNCGSVNLVSRTSHKMFLYIYNRLQETNSISSYNEQIHPKLHLNTKIYAHYILHKEKKLTNLF